MKILHIMGGDISGGAARGAYWLHDALNDQGVESTLFVSGRTTNKDQSVVSLSHTIIGRIKTSLRRKIDAIPLMFYKKRPNMLFSTGFVGYDITQSRAYKEADIVHLHWINAGTINMKHLSKIDKPIVWTLRDMWPFTGGCHYSLSCQKYLESCGACPQLKSYVKKDLSHYVFTRKHRYLPKNLTLIGISTWLTKEAKNSSMFKGYPCETIMNNIDVSLFNRINVDTARNFLDIKTHKKILLCGATNLNDPYKGFQYFLDALNDLDPNSILLVFFGIFDENLIKNYQFEHISLGYLSDNRSLNMAYAAADVFVAPSIQEAFGKTLAESQCAGTPTVCFNATGPKDIVEHKVTGYLATPFNASDLATGIKWVLSYENPELLAKNAREKILQEFDSQIIASKYADLYHQVLRKNDTTDA